MLRRLIAPAVLLAASAWLAACGGQSRNATRTTSSPAPPPAGAGSDRPSSSAAPQPPPPPVVFREGEPIRFKSGKPLKLVPLTHDAEVLAMAPDGSGYVAMEGQRGRIVSPKHPQGIPFAATAAHRASYAPDASRVAVYNVGIEIFDTASGAKLAELEGEPCALSFFSPSELAFFTESLGETNNQLNRYRLGGKLEKFGPMRKNRYCSAAPDGSRFVVWDPLPYTAVGRDGAELLSLNDENMDYAVSPAADRICTWAPNTQAPSALECVRTSDRGRETVIPRKLTPMYASVEFDPTGRRAFVQHTLETPQTPDGNSVEYVLVDFASATRRKIVGFEPKSGSMPQLMTGGELLTQGSASGVMVYDLERGVKHFASHRSMYGTRPITQQPRRVLMYAETGVEWGNTFTADVP